MRRHYHENVLTNLPFGVRFYTSDVTTSGYVPLHWHSSLELLCVYEGELTLHIDSREYHVGPGQFIVVSSGLLHDVANTPNRAIVMQVPMKSMQLFEPHPERLQFNAEKPAPHAAYTAVLEQAKRMARLIQKQPPGYLYDVGNSYLTILKILTVCFCEDAPLAPSANETIKDVLSYIGEHYAEKLTVDELARVAGYNGNYLSRLFHETTGKTLISYIYEVRLTHFYEGLVRTEMDIGQLMEQNGLKNQRTAREMFLKLYGQRPLAVRKRSRERR